ncbi:MAG TPA: ABC transporter permease [Candidatus Limnocylindrales bacterium]|nr:ABC transporter permease [Candidatus Limnocylindrales bacterium]
MSRIPPTGDASEREGEHGVANAWLISKREFAERVRSRLFFVSTLLLAGLAVVVSLTPVLIKAVDRNTTTTIAVASDEAGLARSSVEILDRYLNPPDPKEGEQPPYTFVETTPAEATASAVGDGVYDGALVASRGPDGRILFQLLIGERMGAEKVQQLQIGTFAVGIFDFIAKTKLGGGNFQVPDFASAQVGSGGGATAQPIEASEYAGRRIVGVVFVVLIFITLVIYGMWVAAGVVAEKTSRVMELLISAASPAELVAGKVVGIGLAGLVQYVAILVPALATLLLQDRIAEAVLGSSSEVKLSLGALTPGLLAAYGAFWILGFILYALIYAAAGSLVSRAEDLQVLALPLSLIAIGGYLQAVMALSGGIGPLVRLSSYIPFWSPFVMLTRLTIGRVEPWELVLSFGLLIVSIPIVAVIAIRVYSAGVLLYGQRPGMRAIVGAIVSPPA